MTLLYITLPFVALAGAFLVIGEFSSGGWDGLNYLVYAMAAGVLWAGAVVCYLVWVVIRDGWQPSSFPAMAVLAVLALLAAGWAYRNHAEEADCRAAKAFYARLATLPASERPAAIRDGAKHVRSGTDCALGGVRLALGRHALDPQPSTPALDAERHAILAQLLAAGLRPGYGLLYGFAVSDADPEATRLLLQRRRALTAETGEQWDLFPDAIVAPLLARARTPPDAASDPLADRYRATLAVVVAEARPDPAMLSDRTRKALEELGLLHE